MPLGNQRLPSRNRVSLPAQAALSGSHHQAPGFAGVFALHQLAISGTLSPPVPFLESILFISLHFPIVFLGHTREG
jgi:hypothetical protein